ncbi:hypothetical protein ACVWYN_000044 [Pedobacter sp. UYP24]
MTPSYKDSITRFVMSLIAAHLILLNAFKGNTLDLIRRPKYPYSMIGSVIIALAATYIVCRVTRRLDKQFRWEQNFINRLLLQCAFGVIIPLGIVVVLVTIYFAIAGWWIFDTYWFSANLLPELLMLCVFNCYYLIYYLVVCRDQIFVKPSQPVEEVEPVSDYGLIEDDVELLMGKTVSDIAFVTSTKDGQKNATFKDGKTRPWKHGIKSGYEKLPKELFMVGSRSEIFNFDNIDYSEYTRIDKSMMRVFLIVPANKVIEISRENTSANKARLKKYLK